MSTKHLLDPSLLPLLELAPPFEFSLDNLQRFRDRGLAAAVLGDAAAHGVKREAVTIPGADFDVPCLLYRPVEAQAGSGYLHIHGGGYVAGSVEGSDAMNTRIAAQLGVVVLTVGYRLAPEHSSTGTVRRLLCGAGLVARAGRCPWHRQAAHSHWR